MMRARVLIWLLTISLGLAGTPGSALADSDHHANPNPLWRVYPLGTQPLAKGETPPATPGTRQHSKPAAISTSENTSLIGFTQILVGTALLCTLATMTPIAVQRRRSQSRQIAAGVVNRGAFIVMSREGVIEAPVPAKREPTEPQPARSARTTATPDEAILQYAAAYARASQRGDQAPMAAVRAIIPPITKNPAAYAKRTIAEARRRDLLTSHGRGKARGELTPKALELMKHSAASRGRPPNGAAAKAAWVPRPQHHRTGPDFGTG
jgi:hypothetical protein